MGRTGSGACAASRPRALPRILLALAVVLCVGLLRSSVVRAQTPSPPPQLGATTSAEDSYQIAGSDITLAASIVSDPDTITAGDSAAVTLGAANTSTRTLDSLTITGPADPNPFPDGLAFAGWTDPIRWPAGAMGVTVTYTHADGSEEKADATTPDSLPAATGDPAGVVGFTVTFTGPIEPGAEASIPFTVTSDADQVVDGIDHPITVGADSTAPGGYSGHTTASEILTTVTGDQPRDDCDGSQDQVSGECRPDPAVAPIRDGSLRGESLVRAVDPELGVLSPGDDPGGCTPDEDGFYTGGCVPVTKPGGDDIWRMRLTNTGDLPMERVYAIGRLPTPGDTGAIMDAGRGSQWTPTPKLLTLAGVTGGVISELRVYHDTDQDICTEDLSGPDGCPADDAWTLSGRIPDPPVGGTIRLPANATAIRIEVDLPDSMLAPAGTLTADLTTTAPAVPPTAGTDTIAWSTVAAGAGTRDGTSRGLTRPTEGDKVGVALATGPLQIRNTVDGGGGGFAPAEFPLDLECTSEGQDVDLGADATVTVTAGRPARVDGIPWGARCTVSEDTSAVGGPTFTATTVTVGRDPKVVTIQATNTYALASLALSKRIGVGAVDQDGGPIRYGPFRFSVTCTFLGQQVFAEGFDATTPMVATLWPDRRVTFAGLPAGASCAAVETDTAGADSTTSTGTTGKGTGDETRITGGERIELTLTPDGAGDVVTNEVDFTNTFATGSLTITKRVEGEGVDLWGAGPFTTRLTCLADDSSSIVWDGEIVLGGDEPPTARVDGLYVDSSCQVTETRSGGATGVAVSPAGTFPVTAGSAAQPVAVTVTNTYDVGGLFILKQIIGIDDIPEGLAFTLQAQCQYLVDGVPTEVPFVNDGVFTLSPDYGLATGVFGLLVGTTCTVTELDRGGADYSAVVPDGPMVIGKDEYVSVVVVNGFHSASGRGGADGGGQLPHSGGSGLRPLLWGLLLVLGGALAYTTSRRGRRS